MKKAFSTFLLLILSTFTLALGVFALEPRWTGLSTVTPNINVTDSHYSVIVTGDKGVTKITCTAILYEKDWAGNFTEVAQTSKTVYGNTLTLSGNYSYRSGKTYKLTATVDFIYNGTADSTTVSRSLTA